MTELIDALSRRMTLHTGCPVQRIDTHLSTILLSGDEAWKLKLPLQLPFVDLRSLQVRRDCCEAELRLNRRLAESIYLGVLTVRGDPRSLSIDELEEAASEASASQRRRSAPIEYLVRMRRFAPGALFSERVAAGTLTRDDVVRLAQRLALFDRAADVQYDPSIATAIEDQARNVFAQLRECAFARADSGRRARINALTQWFDREAQRLRPTLHSRLLQGRVRDVHGDLHLANAVVLGDDVTAFDCLEFDDALRRIDVFGDAAFLAMDLHAHDCGMLAHRLIDAWCEAADDHAAVAILALHQVYRAAVRALVAALSSNPDAERIERYLATAERLSAPRPAATLTITHGPSGSGKSHSAARWVEREGALRVRADVERKRLAGLSPLADSHAAGLDLYTREWSNRTYARLEALADAVLTAGMPIVVDAAFLRRPERQRFAALARWHGVRFRILDCQADAATLQSRLVQRAAAGRDPSEATEAVLARQLQTLDRLDTQERAHSFRLPD